MTITEISPVSPAAHSRPAGDTATPDGTGTGTGTGAGPDTARVRLRPRPADATGPTGGFVDGGWWPRSDDLAAELPGLLEAVTVAGYRIRRVTYNLAVWAPAPRRVVVNGQVVRLGGFRSQSPAELVLIDSGGWERTELVVVPPTSEPALADRALALAATPGDQHRAAEILALAAH